jgi:uncharacterized protein
MNAETLLKKHYRQNSNSFSIVLEHSRKVAAKALDIALMLPNSGIDLKFLEEAAILHDIGVSLVRAPDIHCFGSYPYICHGVLGRELLESEGLPKHALICERHVGIGLEVDDIVRQNLPLPQRDMSPITLEEKIVCFADLFYSKKPGVVAVEKSNDQIRSGLRPFGNHKVALFDQWSSDFGISKMT